MARIEGNLEQDENTFRSQPKFKKEQNYFKYEMDLKKCPRYSKQIPYVQHDFIGTRRPFVIAGSTTHEDTGPLHTTIMREFNCRELMFNQAKQLGEVSAVGPTISGKRNQYFFHACVKTNTKRKTPIYTWAHALSQLKFKLVSLGITELAISTLDPALDGILWKITYKF